MNWKGLLLLVLGLGLSVVAFVYYINKTKEHRLEVAMQQSNEAGNNIVVSKTVQMEKLNAQAGRLLNTQTGSSSSSSSGLGTTSASSEQDYRVYSVNIGEHFGYREKNDLVRLQKYLSKGEQSRFDKLQNQLLQSGASIVFRPGEQLVLQETDTQTGWVRVSRIGETDSYWTLYATID
jgi:hypothetical protein